MRAPLARPKAGTAGEFAYTGFGPAGTVVSDSREPLMGIRQVRFANGVRLNLKRTELEKDRVLVQLSLDGGNMLVSAATMTKTPSGDSRRTARTGSVSFRAPS